MPAKKIISLLPAVTEIVCALGLGQNLVGRSHECDYPEWVKNLHACTGANFISGSESNAIDQQVKETLTNSLSLYSINKKLIRQLNPDVVITQAQCDVCAVSLKDVEAALGNLLTKHAEIISVQPDTLDDIFADIKIIAQKLNVTNEGELLIESLEERIGIIGHKLKYIEVKPTVACIEWLEPLMVSGNWIPQLVEIAGGQPVFAQNGRHSPYVSWDALLTEDPEIIIMMPCGFSIGRTLKEMDRLLSRMGFANLRAVKNNRVYIADGNQYFNRPGPRIVDSVEILAEIIYPKQFIFGYEGDGWIKFGL